MKIKMPFGAISKSVTALLLLVPTFSFAGEVNSLNDSGVFCRHIQSMGNKIEFKVNPDVESSTGYSADVISSSVFDTEGYTRHLEVIQTKEATGESESFVTVHFSGENFLVSIELPLGRNTLEANFISGSLPAEQGGSFELGVANTFCNSEGML